MGIAVSLVLIAAGAILRFAVDVQAEGFNLNVMGLVLMIVGAAGLLFSLAFWSYWAPTRRENTTGIREHEYH